MQAFFCTVSHRVGGTLRPVGRWLLASMTLSGYLLRALRAWAKGRCPSAHPALAAVRLGGQGGGLRPSSCPHSLGSCRSGPPWSRQGFAPSGPCPRYAAGRASQPGPLRALDPPAANTARKPRNGPTARFLPTPAGLPPSP